MSSSSARVSLKAYVILRPVTWMGKMTPLEILCAALTKRNRETNLKIKQASPQTAHLTNPGAVMGLAGTLRSEHPNNSLYTYEGTLVLLQNNGQERQVPLGPDQILLRGAQLRNTPWAYGFVVFTGHETKLMRNATATPIKRTAVERQVNVQIVFLFALLLALSLASTIGASVRNVRISTSTYHCISYNILFSGSFLETCGISSPKRMAEAEVFVSFWFVG